MKKKVGALFLKGREGGEGVGFASKFLFVLEIVFFPFSFFFIFVMFSWFFVCVTSVGESPSFSHLFSSAALSLPSTFPFPSFFLSSTPFPARPVCHPPANNAPPHRELNSHSCLVVFVCVWQKTRLSRSHFLRFYPAVSSTQSNGRVTSVPVFHHPPPPSRSGHQWLFTNVRRPVGGGGGVWTAVVLTPCGGVGREPGAGKAVGGMCVCVGVGRGGGGGRIVGW